MIFTLKLTIKYIYLENLVLNNLKIIPFNYNEHYNHVLGLNIKYFSWITNELRERYNIDLVKELKISVKDYSTNFLDILLKNTSIWHFYLCMYKNDCIGMGGVRFLNPNIGELKRMYIFSEFRGKGYGNILIQFLIQKAKNLDFKFLRLDTLPFMKSAINLYKKHGFKERDPYNESEVPPPLRYLPIFMEKELN